MRTIWLRWFRGFTTRTMEPRGRVGWAAVSAYMSYVSPLAVGWRSKSSPYQLGVHSQTGIGLGLLALPDDSCCRYVDAWGGLLGFPAVVGFTDGVNASKPNPKNTDSSTTNVFAFMIS